MNREEPSLETLWLKNIRTLDKVQITDRSKNASTSLVCVMNFHYDSVSIRAYRARPCPLSRTPLAFVAAYFIPRINTFCKIYFKISQSVSLKLIALYNNKQTYICVGCWYVLSRGHNVSSCLLFLNEWFRLMNI
jgi:hypothetical protein